MASGGRSAVWKYFTVIADGKKAECQLCKCSLAYSGGTTNLHSHLKAKHPTSLDSSPAAKQTTLRFPQKQMQRGRWQQLTRHLVEFCAKDLRPLSVVDGVGFRAFVGQLDPSYKVPSHTTMKNYTDYYYSDMKKQCILSLEKEPSVCLTTDAWTSCSTQSYNTVTVHYIDKDWTVHHAVLSTEELVERHTGENLAEALKEVVQDFKIPDSKIAAVSSDNAANIVLAIRNLGWPHVRCFGHSLQLAVNAGLQLRAISSAAASARRLVGHFKKSTVATNELKKRQQQMGLKQHSLLQDVSTRWNSTYTMFDRLIEQRLAIFAVLHFQEVTKPADARVLELSDATWKVIEDLTPVLKPLQIATTVACSETYPTASMVYPIVFGLLQNHMSPKEDDSAVVKEFKQKVVRQLESRFINLDIPLAESPCLIASAMDPRYKSLRFLDEAQQASVWEKVAEAVLAEQADAEQSCGSEEPASSSGAEIVSADSPDVEKRQKVSEPDAMGFLLGDLMSGSPSSESASVSVARELTNFQSEPVTIGNNPLQWWKTHSARFPHIQKLARRYLAIPGTSVPSERIFSAAGNIVTAKRASLDPGTVNELIFIREHLRDRSKSHETSTETPGTSSGHRPESASLPPLPSVPTLSQTESLSLE